MSDVYEQYDDDFNEVMKEQRRELAIERVSFGAKCWRLLSRKWAILTMIASVIGFGVGGIALHYSGYIDQANNELMEESRGLLRHDEEETMITRLEKKMTNADSKVAAELRRRIVELKKCRARKKSQAAHYEKDVEQMKKGAWGDDPAEAEHSSQLHLSKDKQQQRTRGADRDNTIDDRIDRAHEAGSHDSRYSKESKLFRNFLEANAHLLDDPRRQPPARTKEEKKIMDQIMMEQREWRKLFKQGQAGQRKLIECNLKGLREELSLINFKNVVGDYGRAFRSKIEQLEQKNRELNEDYLRNESEGNEEQMRTIQKECRAMTEKIKWIQSFEANLVRKLYRISGDILTSYPNHSIDMEQWFFDCIYDIQYAIDHLPYEVNMIKNEIGLDIFQQKIIKVQYKMKQKYAEQWLKEAEQLPKDGAASKDLETRAKRSRLQFKLQGFYNKFFYENEMMKEYGQELYEKLRDYLGENAGNDQKTGKYGEELKELVHDLDAWKEAENAFDDELYQDIKYQEAVKEVSSMKNEVDSGARASKDYERELRRLMDTHGIRLKEQNRNVYEQLEVMLHQIDENLDGVDMGGVDEYEEDEEVEEDEEEESEDAEEKKKGLTSMKIIKG